MEKNPEQVAVSPKTEKEAISISVAELGDAAAAKRVYEAFRKASTVADVEKDFYVGEGALDGMKAYGERSGISKESIERLGREMNIEEASAEINREEMIVRNRFKDRLRRLAAQAAAVISLMSPNMSRADEYVQEPVTYSQPAEPMVAKASGVDGAAHRESGAVQTETEKPDTRVTQTIEMSDEEWDQYVAREEQHQARVAFEKEFLERQFSSEDEVLQTLHEAALNHENEFLAVYTVGAGGRIKVAFGEFGDKKNAAAPDIIKQMRNLRAEEGKIVFAHTHPLAMAKQAATDASVDGAFRRMPPSLPDFRGASLVDWLDRYDNADNRNEIEKLLNASEDVVVDSEGTWRYQVDFFHPYFQKQREAAVEEAVMKRLLSGAKGSDAQKIQAFYSQMVVPDSIVMERIVQTATKNIRGSSAIVEHARIAGTTAPDGGYELMNEQMKVGISVTPEEKTAATEAFIGFCKERGIDISFTPFSH